LVFFSRTKWTAVAEPTNSDKHVISLKIAWP
jgi:hypothetical protein